MEPIAYRPNHPVEFMLGDVGPVPSHHVATMTGIRNARAGVVVISQIREVTKFMADVAAASERPPRTVTLS